MERGFPGLPAHIQTTEVSETGLAIGFEDTDPAAVSDVSTTQDWHGAQDRPRGGSHHPIALC